jgi:hypothetical protein
MARARKSHISNEEKVKNRSGPLEYPYVVYCSYHREGEDHARCLVLKFTDPASARNMVDQVIGNDEWEWQLWMDRDDMVVTSKGVKIRTWGNEMREIMSVDPADVEREEIKHVLQFKYSSPEGGRKEKLPVHSPLNDDPATVRPGKPVKEKAPPKPKVDLSGMVTAKDIAKKLKVEGREVRGVLRSLKLTKPDHGWAWSKDEAAKIEEKVHAGLKEAKAKKK